MMIGITMGVISEQSVGLTLKVTTVGIFNHFKEYL